MSQSGQDRELFEVRVESGFVATHRRGPDGAEAPPHEHAWRVAVRARSRELDGIGLVVDFRRLAAATREVLAELDGNTLEELPGFDDEPTTPPHVARWLFQRLEDAVPRPRCWLAAVEVEADAGQRFEYRGSSRG